MSKLFIVTRNIDGEVTFLNLAGEFVSGEADKIPAELKDQFFDSIEPSFATVYVSQEVEAKGNGWVNPTQLDRLVVCQQGSRRELDIVHTLEEYPTVGNHAMFIRFTDDSEIEFASGWIDMHVSSPLFHKARVFPINSNDDLERIKQRFSQMDNGITLDAMVVFKGIKE
jgi:hypothetical protein